MRLYLVRHGQTGSNRLGALDTAIPGAELSDTGRMQAEALAERFTQIRLEKLYASTLTRTQQTIAPLSKALGIPPMILDGLREIGAGDWEMRTDEEAVISYMTVVGSWITDDTSVRMSGGESGDEFLARFDHAIETIVGSGAQHALLVSHGAALRTWVGHYCDLSDWGDAAFKSLPNTGVIELDGTVGSWRIISWTGA